MNESDIIDNCQKSQGIISDETIISMHPWVDDPQLEMERLKKQKEEAQKEMLAQYDPLVHRTKTVTVQMMTLTIKVTRHREVRAVK